MTLRIDGDAVRQLRHECAYPKLDFARLVGISPVMLRNIENNDQKALDTITVAQINMIAEHLGVEATTLLHDDTQQTPGPASGSDDARRLVSTLVLADKPLRKTTIAKTFGWNLRRLAHARDAAQPALAAVDLHIHEHRRGWQLNPTTNTSRSDIVHCVTIDGLDTQPARMLFRVYRHHPTYQPAGRLSEDASIALATLERAQLVEHTPQGWRLTQPVVEALNLTSTTKPAVKTPNMASQPDVGEAPQSAGHAAATT